MTPDAVPDPFVDVTIALDMASLLSRVAALATEAADLRRARPDLWPTIQDKLRIFWTADSNAIEGSSLSRADTAFFLREGLTVEGKPLKDFLDARNHADAIDYLGDVVAQRRPVTAGLLKDLNALLLKGVDYLTGVDEQGRRVAKPTRAGTYKSAPNHVLRLDGSIHHYVDPVQVPAAIDRLCAAIARAEEGGEPPVVVAAALAHHEFVRIHPFDDGNGRGARLLMNLILMRAGLPPAVIAMDRRREYLSALAMADQGDRSPFLRFVADSLLSTLTMIVDDLRPPPVRSGPV